MTEQEIAAFVESGASMMTIVAQGAEGLKRWSDSFEQRGGGAVFGEEALEIVTFGNALQAFLTPEWRAIIAEHRTDI